jgi:hypothetical protein
MQTAERLYHLTVLRANGSRVYLTAYPMTHEQCEVVARKQSDRTRPSVRFEEVSQ